MALPEGSQLEPINDWMERIIGGIGQSIQHHFTDSKPQSGAGFHPDTHSFSVSQWKASNPEGDVEPVIKQAKSQGFAITP